jgi:uncharacterized membrane protein
MVKTTAAADRPRSRIASMRNAFFSGLLMLAPLAVTWLVFSALFEKVGGSFRPLFFPYLPEKLRDYDIVWNILATFVVVALITLLGYISRYVLGKYFGGLAERFILSIPGVSNVYTTVKQIVSTFGTQHRQLFSKVVLIEFPRTGVYSIGFLTNRAQGEAQARVATELWTVFVPTTPNPTSGFLLLLPKEQITELDMSVGDGMKMIISGGAVTPPWTTPPSAAPLTAVAQK